MKDPCDLIAARARAIRIEFGLTQEEVAKKTGLSRVSIANIETGNQKPNLLFVYKFAIALKLDLHDILPSKSAVLELDNLSGKDRDFIINLLS